MAGLWLTNQQKLRDFVKTRKLCPRPSKMKMGFEEGEEKPLTPPELARIAGVSADTIRRAIDRGDIDSIVTQKGHRKIPLPSVVDYLMERKQHLADSSTD